MAVKPKKATKREEATAYHEAGHAVVAAAVRYPFLSVTITPTADALGHIQHPAWGDNIRPDITMDGNTKNLLEKAILTLLAGRWAEKRFAGRWNNVGAASDFHEAVNLASYIYAGGKVLQTYINWMDARVEVMVDNRLNWAAIKALAAALLVKRRIGYREARKIIAEAEDSLIGNSASALRSALRRSQEVSRGRQSQTTQRQKEEES